VTGTIAAEAARGCIPPTRRGIRRFRGEFACVLRPSVPRAKRYRRQGTRRPAARHLRGALPASIRSPLKGDRGPHPLPCAPRPRWHRGRHVVGITGAAGLGGRRVVGITSLVLPAADVSSASRGIASRGTVALAAWSLIETGGDLPTAADMSSASRSRGDPRQTFRRHHGHLGLLGPLTFRTPLGGPSTYNRPVAGGGFAAARGGPRGRHVVGITLGGIAADVSSASRLRPSGVAAVNWKRTSRHQVGNRLAGQAHCSVEVTFSVTQIGVSR
jgi:hypothetical protein